MTIDCKPRYALLYARVADVHHRDKLSIERNYAEANGYFIPSRKAEFVDTPETKRYGLNKALACARRIPGCTLIIYSLEDLSGDPASQLSLIEIIEGVCNIDFVRVPSEIDFGGGSDD